MKTVSITDAKHLLEKGEVVAIPTETVYGLGGWIFSEPGLLKIFSTKERPFFDPLIVHVDSIDSARRLTSDWTPAHDALAKAAWPGPLTLIAKKNEAINPLITAGLDSVGLRCPDHPETLELLKHLDGGVAAPSANKFGKTSPTSSHHVAEEFGDTVAILEGGASRVGIESTVVGIEKKASGYIVRIYRPGFYTAQRISEILKDANLSALVEYAESPVAPGQLKHHYMPKIPLVIVPKDFNWEEKRSLIEAPLGRNFSHPAFWRQPTEASTASRELYEKMRSFDQQGFDLILAFEDDSHRSEDWLGIWNRLEKAKSLRLE